MPRVTNSARAPPQRRKRRSNAKDNGPSHNRQRPAISKPDRSKRKKKEPSIESINGPAMPWWELPTRGQLENNGIDLKDEGFVQHLKVEHGYIEALQKLDPSVKAPPTDMGWRPPKEKPSKEIRRDVKQARAKRAQRQQRESEATQAVGENEATGENEAMGEDEAIGDDETWADAEFLRAIGALGDDQAVRDVEAAGDLDMDGGSNQGPPAPTGLMELPTDVLAEVFKYLLVSDKSIMVQDQWTRPCSRFVVLRSERSAAVLYPQILQSCRTCYSEGVKVLYMENTFHYRIRDAGPFPDTSADDGDEYRDSAPKRSRQRRGKGQAVSQERLINVTKFRHLFRRLILEAEHNRVNDKTAEIITAAINVFDPTRGRVQSIEPGEQHQPGDKRKRNHSYSLDVETGRPPSIHTFVLRVAPVWALKDRTFDVLSWFSMDSPIIEALAKIDAQFLNIDLIMRHFYAEYNFGRIEAEKKKAPRDARLKLDLRHSRIVKQMGPADKEAAVDGVTVRDTLRKAKHAVAQVWDLKTHILKKCLACVPEAGDEQEPEFWQDIGPLSAYEDGYNGAGEQ